MLWWRMEEAGGGRRRQEEAGGGERRVDRAGRRGGDGMMQERGAKANYCCFPFPPELSPGNLRMVLHTLIDDGWSDAVI